MQLHGNPLYDCLLPLGIQFAVSFWSHIVTVILNMDRLACGWIYLGHLAFGSAYLVHVYGPLPSAFSLCWLSPPIGPVRQPVISILQMKKLGLNRVWVTSPKSRPRERQSQISHLDRWTPETFLYFEILHFWVNSQEWHGWVRCTMYVVIWIDVAQLSSVGLVLIYISISSMGDRVWWPRTTLLSSWDFVNMVDKKWYIGVMGISLKGMGKHFLPCF